MSVLLQHSDNTRINNFDIRMLNRALKEAEQSVFHQFKTGCVITYRGHILSTAHNVDKTSPAQKKYNRFRHFNNKSYIEHKTHAEILALSKIPYPVGIKIKVNIYIARLCPGKRGGIGLSRPCEACEAAIRDVGIRNVFYTGNNGSLIYERLN